MDTFDRTQLSPKWQFRFDFFDRHGGPKDPAYKETLKTLPFGEKLKVGMNFYALFFGFIYFFILGLWRKALGLILTAAAILLFLLNLRRAGERAGRAAERLEVRERNDAIHRQMLDAAARRPANRDALADRLRDGRF